MLKIGDAILDGGKICIEKMLGFWVDVIHFF